MCKTPDWWRELLAVPGVPNYKKLVWKVWASFSHPKRISEVNRTENYYLPCTIMSPQKELPTTSRFYLCLLRHLGDAEGVDSSIHPCPLVLGREDQSTYWRTTTPVGWECEGAAGRDEVLPLLLWQGSFQRCNPSGEVVYWSSWGGWAPQHDNHACHCPQRASYSEGMSGTSHGEEVS